MRNTPTPLSADLEPDIAAGGLLCASSRRKRLRSAPRLFGVDDSGCIRTKRRRLLTDDSRPPRPPIGPRDLYSRDGVLRGVLRPSPDKLRVGIVAQDGWSGWLSVADALGWHTVWVAIGDCSIGDAWRHSLGSLAVHPLSISEFSPSLVIDSNLDVLLVDGRLPHKSSDIWLSATLRLVLGTSFPRRGGTAVGWESHSASWSHSECGGVSSACGLVTCAGRSSKIQLPASQQLGSTDSSSRDGTANYKDLQHFLLSLTRPRRQLSSILGTTEGGRSTRPPAPALWPPQVTTTSRAGFHDDGLFPAESSDPCLDLPDCLSPTGWACRKMTPKELLTTADIPVALQDSAFYLSGILPMSLMLQSPIGMLHLLGVHIGGLLCMPPSVAVSGALKDRIQSIKPPFLSPDNSPLAKFVTEDS